MAGSELVAVPIFPIFPGLLLISTYEAAPEQRDKSARYLTLTIPKIRAKLFRR